MPGNSSTQLALHRHHTRLVGCTRCPAMIGPPVHGAAAVSSVMLVGQAPGNREIELRKPFAWTAGKTLFGWFAGIGMNEEQFRRLVYMSAVCRCFPGKHPAAGDRVPNREEIANCSSWLHAELKLLQPRLIIPAGKLAIAQFIGVDKLDQVIGQQFRIKVEGGQCDLIPLPHPSGASVWHRIEPGKGLLAKALALIARHPAWRRIVGAAGGAVGGVAR